MEPKTLLGLGVAGTITALVFWPSSDANAAPSNGGGGGAPPPGGGGKTPNPGGFPPGTLVLPAGTQMPSQNGDTGQCSTIQCGPARVGYASNPLFQWYYVVKSGDNASSIAKKFTGDDRRHPELVDYVDNAYRVLSETKLPSGIISTTYAILRALKKVGDPGYQSRNWAPTTPIQPGDRLPLPMSWNIYIDEQGGGFGAGKIYVSDGGLPPSYY